MKKYLLNILVILLLTTCLSACNTRDVADSIVYGNIITMDDNNPTCEAVASKDGKIIFVGSKEDAKKFIDANTKILDYGNNYVYPGFLEAHVHGFLTGYRSIGQADLSLIYPTDYDAYRNIILEFIKNNPDKDLYLAAGWCEDERYVSKEYLDEICSDKPLIMNSGGGHAMLLNTKALEWAGIDAEYAKKMGYDQVHVDKNGEPDGYVCELAVIELTNKLVTTHEEAKDYILAFQDILIKNGYTGVCDAGSELFYNDDIYNVYKELEDEGKLKLRVYSYMIVDDNVENPKEAVEKAVETRKRCNNEYFNIIGLKAFLDGVSESRTSWMLNDDIANPGYHGLERFNDHDKMVELITLADKEGLSVHVHSIGDGAVKFMLDCIEDAEEITGDLDQRNVMAHLEFVDSGDFKRMADTNTIPAVAPLWTPKFQGEYEIVSSYVGEEKNELSYPIKSFIDAGAKIVFHSDYPISPILNVSRSIFMAEARAVPKGENEGYDSVHNIKESINRKQSFEALTTNVAYSYRQEDKMGTLEVGKLANVTVYSCDFLNDDLDTVANSHIVATVIDGDEVYKNQSNTIDPIYHTTDEWKELYTLEEYKENKKLNEIPNDRPNVTCVNGTFVGNTKDGIDIYKGIPYAKTPVGELRFQKAQPVDSSNDIYDASYYGQSFMQPIDYLELASQYGMSEDCLRLNVWNNTSNNDQSKPVLVFIHGGGFLSGGTSDPLYDGYNFVYYNPDVIMVTIGYRAGVLGFVDLSDFEGSEDYKYSKNNGFYDQIEALRWIKNNIKQFGGDPENVTICGESAGGCFVSGLCVMDEAKGLFNKAIPMSGAVNLCIPLKNASALPAALKKKFNASSIKDIQNIPFDELRIWWEEEYETLINDPMMDGETLSNVLFGLYENGYTKDLTILQGHTNDEFRYYYSVFNNCLPFYQAICDELVKSISNKSHGNFDELYERYKQVLLDLGYKEDEINRCLADDMSLKIYNTYQATLHANNGGKGYCYTFATPYDIKFDDFELGAAHAIDCFYLFGNFDGEFSFGTNKQVDTSIAFQKMIANFCKTGNPSTDEIEWPEYENEHRYKMIINENDFEVIENPEKERVDILLEMLDQFDTLYGFGLVPIIEAAYNNHPEAAEAYISSLSN